MAEQEGNERQGENAEQRRRQQTQEVLFPTVN